MKQADTVRLLCACLSLSTMGCGSDDQPKANPEPMSHESAHWAYAGAEGPEYWGTLSEDFALCGSGRYQSPVNFPQALAPKELNHLSFDYAPTGAAITNNGHTIVVELDDDTNELLVAGESHALLQFHFHGQSEHLVDGQAYPLELHLVHASASGRLAVVGIFLQEGEENEALAEVFHKMAASSEEPLLLDANLDLTALLPQARLGWNYSGSLTTPPCTEGVNWNVHAAPLTVSAAQLAAFLDIHAGSYRPIGENTDIQELLEGSATN